MWTQSVSTCCEMHSANRNTDTLLSRGQHSSWDQLLKLGDTHISGVEGYLSQSRCSLKTEAGRVFCFVLALFLYLAACILASQFQGCWPPIHPFDLRQSQLSSSEKQTVHLDSDEDSSQPPPPPLTLASLCKQPLVSQLPCSSETLSSRFNISTACSTKGWAKENTTTPGSLTQIKVKTLEQHGEMRPAGKSLEEEVATQNVTSGKDLRGIWESSDLLLVPAYINV